MKYIPIAFFIFFTLTASAFGRSMDKRKSEIAAQLVMLFEQVEGKEDNLVVQIFGKVDSVNLELLNMFEEEYVGRNFCEIKKFELSKAGSCADRTIERIFISDKFDGLAPHVIIIPDIVEKDSIKNAIDVYSSRNRIVTLSFEYMNYSFSSLIVRDSIKRPELTINLKQSLSQGVMWDMAVLKVAVLE